MHAINTIEVQRQLNRFYLREISEPERFRDAPTSSEYLAIHNLEDAWNGYEESRVGDLSNLPRCAESFRVWYKCLHQSHRREVAGFFEHLAEQATPEELALYVSLEEEVDGRFDDVIALAQLGMRGDMKLALAENFWDEMGLGELDAMHTVMFSRSAEFMRSILSHRGVDVGKAVPTAAVKNGNLLLMYALRRRYGPRLLGALAILEHTAPYRFAKTVKGLRRVGVPESAIMYHELHIAIDAKHGTQLIERVLMPLVARSTDVMHEVCMGCLIRYHVAVDYYRSIQEAIVRLGLGQCIASNDYGSRHGCASATEGGPAFSPVID